MGQFYRELQTADAAFDDEEEKEVAWVGVYSNVHRLLTDLGRFGTSNECIGFAKVPTAQFTASSSLSSKTGVKRCKLNGKGAWTGNYKKEKESEDAVNIEWVEVDLGKVTTLYCVALQGHRDKDEWATRAVLMASRDGADDWNRITLSNGAQLECSDRNTVQVFMFSKWVKARFVRISIMEFHTAPSLRWDLLFGDNHLDMKSLS